MYWLILFKVSHPKSTFYFDLPLRWCSGLVRICSLKLKRVEHEAGDMVKVPVPLCGLMWRVTLIIAVTSIIIIFLFMISYTQAESKQYQNSQFVQFTPSVNSVGNKKSIKLVVWVNCQVVSLTLLSPKTLYRQLQRWESNHTTNTVSSPNAALYNHGDKTIPLLCIFRDYSYFKKFPSDDLILLCQHSEAPRLLRKLRQEAN